jgi:hypothetical protein
MGDPKFIGASHLWPLILFSLNSHTNTHTHTHNVGACFERSKRVLLINEMEVFFKQKLKKLKNYERHHAEHKLRLIKKQHRIINYHNNHYC